MSPPKKIGLYSSRSAAVLTDLAKIRAPKPGAKRSICASILPVMSTAEPSGTWQYPQSVWHRSEEHTSELQSRGHLVCRLLLEKKKNKNNERNTEQEKNKRTTNEK